MSVTRDGTAKAGAGWRKLAVLVPCAAAVGQPINEPKVYALLVVVAVAVFTGEVSARLRAWVAALAVIAVAIAAQRLVAPPRIDEGHNLFLPDATHGALLRGLPADVYKAMADEFEQAYPPAVRCARGSPGCWQGTHPERTFAFSADGIFQRSDLSRSVTAIDFSDPVWQRLGFVNEKHYNWYTVAPDVHRVDRDRRFFMGLKRWHLAMPWFELIRLPPEFAGGELCWRGEIMWEGEAGRFAALPGGGCRAITAADAGRRVVGLAIRSNALAMHLKPPWPVRLLQVAGLLLALAAVLGAVLLLVRIDARRMVLPLVLIGLAVVVIAADDASFLGGVRPFDGGDDGLFYDGVGREMLQNLLSGDITGFLRGGEAVFYYGGPGLRYFRALEHIVFGESYLGYLSLVLLLPVLMERLFARFLPRGWSIAAAIVFVAVPAGALFGTTFFQYEQWAGRGFADPAAYILFAAGLLVLVTAADGKFFGTFFAALLFALAIFTKPIVAPAAAVLLSAAGLAALWQRQGPRLAGLVLGFLPVFSMALHNWMFGHVFVLFSSNSTNADLLVMPPSAWLAALHGGAQAGRAGAQIVYWLAGPAQAYAAIPLDATGVVILVYVAAARRFDPWLRLVAVAALTQQAVALFYDAAIARYHFLSWLLTMLVAVVWLHEVGVPWLKRRYPAPCRRIADNPVMLRLASGLAWLHKVSA